MPRAYDLRQMPIDRNPLQTLTPDWGKLPKLDPLDPAGLIDLYIGYIKEVTGIDLSGIVEFMDWLSEQVGLVMSGFGTVWQDLLNGITEVFTPLAEDVEAAWNDAVAAIEGIFNTGKAAKLSADNANIGVEKLKAQLSGGGWDEFDYESSNALPSSLYEVTYSGPGAGNYGPNGSGYLVWKPSGSGMREVIYRRTDVVMSGDYPVITAVWAEKPRKVLFPKTYGYICGRMSLVSNNTHVRAKISDSDARIEAVVTGTVTQIDGSVSLDINDGDVFELLCGDLDPDDPHPRRFQLRQNGRTVLTVEDGAADGTGAVSEMGSGYRQPGIGCRVDNYLLFFQNPAPSLSGWTWALQPEGS